MNQDLFTLLITQIWQVTLLFIVVWIVVRVFAEDRPHLAHALWVLLLVKCITPPIWSSPTSPFCWMTSTQHVSFEEDGVGTDSSDSDRLRSTDSSLEPIVVHMPRGVAEKNVLDSDPKQIVESDAATVVVKQNNSSNWSAAILCFWLTGAVIGFLLTLFKFGLFVHWIRRSPICDDAEINQIVTRLSKQLGIRRKVRVRILDRPVGPAVLGVIRPTILLPSTIVKGQTLEKLRPLLAHELIHVRRGDLWWAMVQTIATSLFWFHPLVWFAVRMVTRESERSCDEETVTCLGCRPAIYARGLLEVLEHKHQLRVAPALPGVRPVDITTARLERVMRLGNGSHRKTPVWVWLVTLICGALTLPGAAIVLGQDSATANGQDTNLKEASSLPQLLPQAKPGIKEADWVFKTYDLSDLIIKLREQDQDQSVLLGLLPIRRAGPNGESSTPRGRSAETVVQGRILRLGNKEPNMKIVADRLYVMDTSQQQSHVENLLASLRNSGLEQFIVEVRFITMPNAQREELGMEWSMADPTVGRSVGLGKVASSGIWVSPIGETFIDQSRVDLIPEAAPSHGHGLVSATSIVEKNSPVLHSVIDDKQVREIINRIKGDARLNMLSAPTVTMFNRREASIKDVVTQPFVVGHKRIKDSEVRQPIVRLVESGTTLQLKPVLTETNTIQLTCNLTLSSILSVDTVDITDSVAKEPVQVQVPEVESMKIRSSMEVPVGKTLVLASSRRNAKGEREAFMTLVTCRLYSDCIRQSKLNPEPKVFSTEPMGGVDGKMVLRSSDLGDVYYFPKSKQAGKKVEENEDRIVGPSKNGSLGENGVQLEGGIETEIINQPIPFLSNIPYVGRLFKNVGIRRKKSK